MMLVRRQHHALVLGADKPNKACGPVVDDRHRHVATGRFRLYAGELPYAEVLSRERSGAKPRNLPLADEIQKSFDSNKTTNYMIDHVISNVSDAVIEPLTELFARTNRPEGVQK
jgi:hypothetical protein